MRRLSELMEPVSLLIDEASDLAADGKTRESIEKYRAALTELDTIEMENPERAASAEFATLRNKRAYVNAAIDSLLLEQVRANVKSVAVSDTTALEKRLAAEREAAAEKKKEPSAPAKSAALAKSTVEVASSLTRAPPAKSAEPAKSARPLSPREQVLADIEAGNYESAAIRIDAMLVEKPNGAMALNLKAMMESAQGKLKEAERTLDQAIMSNPRSYFAYYNMAALVLQADASDKKTAKRYYETGRTVGGPEDPQLEEALR